MSNKKAEESFINCARLYAHYKQLDLTVKQARLVGDEVVAEPIDFCADVDLKIRRALAPSHRTIALVERLCLVGKAELVPQADRVKVGQAFIEAGLEEAYKILFWKANQKRRQADAEEVQREQRTADADEPDGVPDAEIAQIFESAQENQHWVQQ